MTGFTVELSSVGADGKPVMEPGGNWEALEGGGAMIFYPEAGLEKPKEKEPALELEVEPLTLRGDLRVSGFTVEIEGCPVASAGVEEIEVGDLNIDVRELTTGLDVEYRVYAPGAAHFGAITIRSRVAAGNKELQTWWVEAAKGKSIRKTITVNLRNAKGEAVRTLQLSGALPVIYRPFVLDGSSPVAVEEIVVVADGFSLSGTDSRSAVMAWIDATVQGKPWKQNLTITEMLRGGKPGRKFTYFDAFPMSYSLKLGKASGNVQTETLTVKIGRIEFKT